MTRRYLWASCLAAGCLASAAHADNQLPLYTGESYEGGDEKAEADAIVADITAQQNKEYATKRMLRDAHPHAQGCLAATFTVNPNLDSRFQTGIFKPGKKYLAFARFSSSLGPAGDHVGDARGLAIKVLGTEDESILGAETDHSHTQDFIQINAPAFPAKSAAEFAAILKLKNPDHKAENALKFIEKNFFFRIHEVLELLKMSALSDNNGKSQLNQSYFSMVPYKLESADGSWSSATKFMTVPCNANQALDRPIEQFMPQENQLREDLQDWFKTKPACFKFKMQIAGDHPQFQPDLEDGMQVWPVDQVPPVEFATIDIQPQLFKTDQRLQYCDALSFQPWHAHPKQRPLGGINRARKIVYDAVSKLRHEHNHDEERREPEDHEAWSALTGTAYTVWPSIYIDNKEASELH